MKLHKKAQIEYFNWFLLISALILVTVAIAAIFVKAGSINDANLGGNADILLQANNEIDLYDAQIKGIARIAMINTVYDFSKIIPEKTRYPISHFSSIKNNIVSNLNEDFLTQFFTNYNDLYNDAVESGFLYSLRNDDLSFTYNENDKNNFEDDMYEIHDSGLLLHSYDMYDSESFFIENDVLYGIALQDLQGDLSGRRGEVYYTYSPSFKVDLIYPFERYSMLLDFVDELITDVMLVCKDDSKVIDCIIEGAKHLDTSEFNFIINNEDCGLTYDDDDESGYKICIFDNSYVTLSARSEPLIYQFYFPAQ